MEKHRFWLYRRAGVYYLQDSEIRGSRTAEGSYEVVQDYTPTTDGDQELELPINLPEMFFQIEKLPVPQ